jgi:hypothetical protein
MPSSGVYEETATITSPTATYAIRLRRDRAVEVPLKLSILRGRHYRQIQMWVQRHGWTVAKP